MRRADRLFQIVQMLRHRRLTTAAQLAERLEVSERTIYRDVADLMRSGIPILGEAGVGYKLGKHFDLPPLMFDNEEMQALVLGARMVETWADPDLRKAARSALDKVEAVVPPKRRNLVRDTPLFALGFEVPGQRPELLGALRKAIDQRRVVELDYTDREKATTTRRVRGVGLYFWGYTWTLGAWCELRRAFRNFRLDRVGEARVLDDTFELEGEVTFEAYVKEMKSR